MTRFWPHALASRLQPCAHHPNQSVAKLRITLKLGRMGDDHQSMVEVDDGSFSQRLLGNLPVDRLALLEFRHLARLFEPTVDVVIAVMSVVLRRPAFQEDVAVAVRIYAPAPTDEEDLEAPLLRFGERGGKFGNADLQIETGLSCHGLQNLRHLAHLRIVRHHEVDRYGCRHAGIGNELFGLSHVAARHRELFLVVGALRAHPLVAGQHLAVEHHVGESLTVDGRLQRLAYAWILAEWAVLAGLAVGKIEREPEVAYLDLGCELELRIGADLL